MFAKTTLQKIAASILVFASLIGAGCIPLFAQGQTSVIVPCTGGAQLHPGTNERECNTTDFINLVKRIIDLLFFFSIPLTAISFTYAGFLYLTAAGNSGNISKANGIFTKVLMGFVVMLSAWLIVKLVASMLLNPEIKLPINLG